MFNINDKVWVAGYDNTPENLICEECGGTGRIRIILHDESQVSIQCEGCKRGYYAPEGYKIIDIRKPIAISGFIINISLSATKTEYSVSIDDNSGNGLYFLYEKVFDNMQDAYNEAVIKTVIHNEDIRNRHKLKVFPTKKWSQNVSYHRKELRDLKSRIEYHEKQLNWASLMAKEEKIGK